MPAELELKLAIDASDVEAFIRLTETLGWQVHSHQRLTNTYFDTPDQALKRERVALRVRQAGERWIQTLKTSGVVDSTGISRRGEWEWDLPSCSLDKVLVAEYLPASLDLEQLAPLFTTDFHRTTWMVTEQGTSIEVALDRGAIRGANRELPISEVELELKNGDANHLVQLADKLKEHISLRVDTGSKAQRAQALIDGGL